MAAQPVLDPAEASKILRLLPLKCPERVSQPVPMPTGCPHMSRVTPTLMSVLDYSKGFARTDGVTAERLCLRVALPPGGSGLGMSLAAARSHQPGKAVPIDAPAPVGCRGRIG
jgi:hypothetical protein